MKIPCISVMQPHAQLIALGAKAIETRSRDFTAGYRGPIAIHASKGKDYMHLCSEEPFYYALRPYVLDRCDFVKIGHFPERFDAWLPLGCIVAVGDLVDVVRVTETNRASHIISRHLNPEIGIFSPDLIDHARAVKREGEFGDYSEGRYLYLLRNVVALPSPIPAKGRLGLWQWEAPEDVARLLDGRTHDEMPGMGER